MTLAEISLLMMLCALIAMCITLLIAQKSKRLIFSPLTITLLYFIVYFVVGPVSAILSGNTFFVGRDMRQYFEMAWLAACIGLAMMAAGYFSSAYKVAVPDAIVMKPLNEKSFVNIGVGVLVAGYASVALWVAFSGISLEIFGLQIGEESALLRADQSRVSYFYHAMNFVFIGAFILYACRAVKLRTAILLLAPVILVFLAIGFRYRLLFSVGGLVILYFIRERRAISLTQVAILGAIMMFIFGAVGLARQYYFGLDLEVLFEQDFEQFFFGSLGETNTFFVLGSLIEYVPELHPHVGFEPFIYVFILPIPRFIWEGKPFPDYLFLIQDALGTSAAQTAGAAAPFLGEYYMAFGWLGLAGASLAFGVAARVVWERYVRTDGDPRSIVTYALALPFFYYVLSRGYIAQQFQDFCFIVLPAMIAAYVATPNRARKNR